MGQQVLQRYEEWGTHQLGTPLRVGSSVQLLRDTSANRLVEAGPGTVTEVHFDVALQQAVLSVRHFLGITYEVTLSGLGAATETSSLPRPPPPSEAAHQDSSP
jgi:hypothetical protein